MKSLQSFLGCLSLEAGIVWILIFDILHFLWHFFIFLPKGSGREVYIFQASFDMDADLFLFYSTNVCLLMIKMWYGVTVIVKKFKEYTNTYAAITNVSNLLIVFLDFAMAIYIAKERGEWYGFIFVFGMLVISIYFILITRALNFKVREARNAAKAQSAVAKDAPLIGNQKQDQNGDLSDDEKDENNLEEDDEDKKNLVAARN